MPELARPAIGADDALLRIEALLDNIYFGMIDDPLAMRTLDEIGADRVLWGSDFPHPPSTKRQPAQYPVEDDVGVFGGILDRFPRLRLVLGEYEVAWVPYFRFRVERALRLFTSDFGLRKPTRRRASTRCP